MAIYISGVKNLPEQVQKNKDDIEDLQTADTNLDAKIDQAIADRKEIIDASGNATIIKNPTENVIVSLNETLTNRIFGVSIDGTPKLSIDETSIVANENTAVNGSLVVSGDIAGHGDLDIDGNITAGGNIVGDSVSVSGNITAGGEVEGATLKAPIINVPDDINSFVINCKDNNNVNHVLQFDADTQKLTIDGNEVGGKQLYRHNIFIIGETTTPARTYSFYFNIINDDPTSLNSMASLYNYVSTKNIDTYAKALTSNGLFRTSNTNYHIVACYKGGSNNSLAIAYINDSSGNIQSFEYITLTTLINDTIETI